MTRRPLRHNGSTVLELGNKAAGDATRRGQTAAGEPATNVGATLETASRPGDAAEQARSRDTFPHTDSGDGRADTSMHR